MQLAPHAWAPEHRIVHRREDSAEHGIPGADGDTRRRTPLLEPKVESPRRRQLALKRQECVADVARDLEALLPATPAVDHADAKYRTKLELLAFRKMDVHHASEPHRPTCDIRC